MAEKRSFYTRLAWRSQRALHDGTGSCLPTQPQDNTPQRPVLLCFFFTAALFSLHKLQDGKAKSIGAWPRLTAAVFFSSQNTLSCSRSYPWYYTGTKVGPSHGCWLLRLFSYSSPLLCLCTQSIGEGRLARPTGCSWAGLYSESR